MIVAVIPAKGGSKRLPRKNMFLINGKPLLEYTVKYIEKSKLINKFYVSTDNVDIINYCIQNKIKYVKRPESLGGDTPIIEVYKHFLTQVNFSDKINVILGLQPDHPDRRLSVDKTIELFLKEKADRLVSKNEKGEKNGAHYILSKRYFTEEITYKDITVIDNCTNIHYKEDILKAEKYLKENEKNS